MGRSWTIDSTTWNEVDGSGNLVPDGNGNIWYADDIDGWQSAGLRQNLLDKVGAVGQILAMSEYQSRLITIKNGLVLCPSEAARYAVEIQLATMLSVTESSAQKTLTVHEDIDRICSWYLAGEHIAQEMRPQLWMGTLGVPGIYYPLQIEANLLCIDPRKYSAAVHTLGLTGSNQPLVNAGNIGTPWTMTVTGAAVSSHGLQFNNQDILVFTNAYESIPSPLLIDSSTESVTDGSGNNVYGVIKVGNWQSLTKGSTNVKFAGTGTASISWRDAWI